MFRKTAIAAASATALTANACGQQLAMVQTVDLQGGTMTVKVGDVPHKLAADQAEAVIAVQVGDRHYRAMAGAVELVAKNGTRVQLADFREGEPVDVVVEGEAVTQIRKT